MIFDSPLNAVYVIVISIMTLMVNVKLFHNKFQIVFFMGI